MSQEYETKILDINSQEIETKLISIGAKKKFEVLYKRWVFDIESKETQWIRLRDDGKTSTLTYKKRTGSGICETEEIETQVLDFETTAQILQKLNFKDKYYQENKRTMYELNNIEFSIDSWPMIPTYLEIESTCEKKVKEGLKLLNLENKDIGNISVVNVYKKYNIDLHSIKNLKYN